MTVFPYGFEPDEITRPAGPFVLAMDNRLGTEEISLHLATARNEAVAADPIRRGRPGTYKLVDLPPGTYVLSEESHPQWSCTITITP